MGGGRSVYKEYEERRVEWRKEIICILSYGVVPLYRLHVRGAILPYGFVISPVHGRDVCYHFFSPYLDLSMHRSEKSIL